MSGPSATAAMSQQRRYTHNGLRVPYITPWTCEVQHTPRLVIRRGRGGTGLGYADEGPYDRDHMAALWVRQAIAPGKRRPDFPAMHSMRHGGRSSTCCASPRPGPGRRRAGAVQDRKRAASRRTVPCAQRRPPSGSPRSPVTAPVQPPLVFVYDRHATPAREILRLRLETCAEYTEAQVWQVGGWFVDEGDAALTNDVCPAFDAMCNAIQAAGTGVPRVCLVNDWDRLSRDQEARGLLTRRVLHLGGWVETCLGEQRRPDGTWVQRARLNSAPITA